MMATSALRACSRKMTQTSATMRLSSNSVRFKRVDGAVDQVGAVVDGLDAHALRQARRNLREPILHVLDDRQRILAEALQRDAGDDLPFPVHFGDAAALVGRELDAGHVLQQHRDALVVLNHDLLEIGEALDVAAPAHREFGLGDLDRAAADIHVAVADRVADFARAGCRAPAGGADR